MLLTPATNEVVVDAASGGAWVNQTLRQVSRTGVNRSTPEAVCNHVSFPTLWPQREPVGCEETSIKSPGLVSNTQKMDDVVDRSLPDNLDSASIFRNVIGHNLSDGCSNDLYLRRRKNFVNYPVQTQAPYFVDLGIPAIITLNESGVLGNPVTRILRPTDGSHWRSSDHVFGEATAFGMSAANSDHNYSCKNSFLIWR